MIFYQYMLDLKFNFFSYKIYIIVLIQAYKVQIKAVYDINIKRYKDIKKSINPNDYEILYINI